MPLPADNADRVVPQDYVNDLPDREDYLHGQRAAETITVRQLVELRIMEVRRLLSVFAQYHPNNELPRLAMVAAEKWLEQPTEEHREEARAMAHSVTEVVFDWNWCGLPGGLLDDIERRLI